jgi:hypothetical protein
MIPSSYRGGTAGMKSRSWVVAATTALALVGCTTLLGVSDIHGVADAGGDGAPQDAIGGQDTIGLGAGGPPDAADASDATDARPSTVCVFGQSTFGNCTFGP